MGVVNTEAVVASVLYSVWVLEFIVRQCHSTQAPHRAGVQTWEANCTPTEHIKDMVKYSSSLLLGIEKQGRWFQLVLGEWFQLVLGEWFQLVLGEWFQLVLGEWFQLVLGEWFQLVLGEWFQLVLGDGFN